MNVYRPEATAAGSSAAEIAFRMKKTVPPMGKPATSDSSSRALMAATGAFSTRKRSGSTPEPSHAYPGSERSSANALNAATKANNPSQKPARTFPADLPGLSKEDALRVHNAAVTNMSREMYTSHPPVAPETDEKNRQAGLRAATISMAKSMYETQQRTLEAHAGQNAGQRAALSAHNRRPSTSEGLDEDNQSASGKYVNLQEAAQKLASERLAKLNIDSGSEYRDYYGTNPMPRTRLSMQGRRRRSSSDGQLSDRARSDKIRSEMSLFNTKISEVDAKKRQKDRDTLMAIAQRNVTKNIQGIDEKVFADTGKASPALKADWETKARTRAEADSKARMENHKKIDIGGGKFMDKAEVDAIALSRVQPTLDEITDKAEKERAKDEARRKAEEERRLAEEEHDRQERERNAKSKEEWKRFKGDISRCFS